MKSARIKFLTEEEGGRAAAPIKARSHYRTLAGPTISVREAQWTLVVEFDEDPKQGEWAGCKVNYLCYTHPLCPPLPPGTRLNMFEGLRLTAVVKVTG